MTDTRRLRAQTLIGACTLALLAGCAGFGERPPAAASPARAIAGAPAAAGDGQSVFHIEDTVAVDRTSQGEELYCRRIAPTGTRLLKTVCFTESERRVEHEKARELMRRASY